MFIFYKDNIQQIRYFNLVLGKFCRRFSYINWIWINFITKCMDWNFRHYIFDVQSQSQSRHKHRSKSIHGFCYYQEHNKSIVINVFDKLQLISSLIPIKWKHCKCMKWAFNEFCASNFIILTHYLKKMISEKTLRIPSILG